MEKRKKEVSFNVLEWRKKAKKKKKEKKLTVVDERQDLLPRQRPVLRHARGVRGVKEHVVAQMVAGRGDEVTEVDAFFVGAAGGCRFEKSFFFVSFVFFFRLASRR